jgi:alpha-D-xyloside xylohydrolase
MYCNIIFIKKMKHMKRTKLPLFIMIILSLIMVILNSCNQTRMVNITVSEINDFAVFEITNPHGQDVIIQPVSNDTGSIGFEAGGKIFWLTGEPNQTERSDEITTFIWDINVEDKVKLQIASGNNEINFQLSLVTQDSLKKPEKWFININATDDEYFTGAFERVVDGGQGNSWRTGLETALNLRNEKVEMKVQPTVSAYSPFYLSSNNYGFFVHGTWPGVFDFCKATPNIVRVVFEDPGLVFKLYLGSAKEIVQKHALETGPSFLPPRWAFGPWRWRDEHRNNKTYFDGSEVNAPYNSEIVEDVLMMKAYDIPCMAYWIDRPWGPGNFGYDDFEIDYERLPNFEEMITWLNNMGMELMLWICPWAYGDMANVAKEREYGLVSRSRRSMFGRPPGRRAEMADVAGERGTVQSDRPPGPMGEMANVAGEQVNAQFFRFMRQTENMVVMDFSNPEASKWWGENGPGKLAEMGVKGFKLDRGDGERLVDSLNLFNHAGVSYRENYNDYIHQFVKATYEAVEPVLGDDFILFPRGQYTGSARYGAMWAGDTDNSAEGLRSVLIGMQRCAVMGYPLWGSDTGGYPKRLQREVTMRWLGFSCFSPIMEVGPTNNRGFWGMDSEPSYDHELLAVWRFYTNLRMSLVDYVHNMAKIASETGMPVVRPLFLEYPEQKESWNDWATYKLGDDLLVSVIWENGKTQQQVYLPAGETWINLWDNQEYQGRQYIEVDAPLHQTPVFLRKGSNLVLPDFNELYEESVAITSVKYQMSNLETQEGWR